MSPTKKQPVKLTLKEVAERLRVPLETARGWRKRGLFPRAESLDTPRGPIWLIPLSDVENFKKPVAGRPPKSKATGKRAKT